MPLAPIIHFQSPFIKWLLPNFGKSIIFRIYQNTLKYEKNYDDTGSAPAGATVVGCPTDDRRKWWKQVSLGG